MKGWGYSKISGSDGQVMSRIGLDEYKSKCFQEWVGGPNGRDKLFLVSCNISLESIQFSW